MVAHEKRNPAQLFCAVPTQNDLALSSLLFSAHPTQKLGYPSLRGGHQPDAAIRFSSARNDRARSFTAHKKETLLRASLFMNQNEILN